MKKVVEIAGRELILSNLDKVLFPSTGFTKALLLEYYRQVSSFILPHLKGRAATLKRFPDGVTGESFFEKRCPIHRPSWVRTASVSHRGGEPLSFCLIDELETLIWVANLAAIELHVPLSKAESPGTPDSVVFDLDPGEGAGILECAKVALILRELFSRFNLASWVKTSGQKGLHVFIPLNDRSATFEETKTFSKAVALTLQRSHPTLVTSLMAKEERAGRVFINWSQNDASKTMACVYSLRAREKPFASFPIEWTEVEKAVGEENPSSLSVDAANALRLTSERGDAFAVLLTKHQTLPR